MKERIKHTELQLLYGVDRHTIMTWSKKYGLPLIKISSHSKYIRREDLVKWEDEMMR